MPNEPLTWPSTWIGPGLGCYTFSAVSCTTRGNSLRKLFGVRSGCAMNIRWLMVAYNFFMVAVSLAIFLFLGVYGWFGTYNWYCQPVDYTDSREAILVSILSYSMTSFFLYSFYSCVIQYDSPLMHRAGSDPGGSLSYVTPQKLKSFQDSPKIV